MKHAFIAATALAGGLVSITPAAQAGEKSLKVFGGFSAASEFDGSASYSYTGSVAGGGTDTDAFDAGASADLESGFVVGAAFGVTLGDFLLEGEIAQRTGDISELTFTEGGATFSDDAVEGEEFRVTSFMANAWYEYDFAEKWTASIGAGAGIARGDVGDFDGESAFAWQIGVGVRRALTPRLSAGVGYRYFNAPDLVDDESTQTFGNPAVATSTVTESLTADYVDQSILIDLSLRF